MNLTSNSFNSMNLADWLAIPDDVKAGIFEEIVELHPQGAAEQHWAWPFVAPFLIAESAETQP